jgi:hypothetical protein
MAAIYPDVIGEYIAATERFVADGLQYAGYFSPAVIAPGQVAHLYLFLQNVLNIPLTAHIKIQLPQTGFLRGRKPLLKTRASGFQVKLAAAEAGLLTIPVTTTELAHNNQYSLTVELKAEAKSRGDRIRLAKAESRLKSDLIDSPVGLNLVGSLGATYAEKPARKASFKLNVTDEEAESSAQEAELKHSYEKIWDRKDAKFFTSAIREINDRQVQLKKDLTVEALYANLYAESVARFTNAGLGLRVGEAIILAKILTYSCQYFLSNPALTHGLLLPIWERAFELEADTTDSLDVIRKIGYYHLLKLSGAISFGLIGRAVGRQLWSLAERQAVVAHIADSIEMGEPLDLEFLYLPLLMAGTQIAGKLQFEGEDVGHTLALASKARQARINLFRDEDMAQADRIYNQILKQALA